ncbi:MAG TPA: tetratricopeptide repeat protein [Verrucomicrobiae bacterium]|nr:tetratricopeptide repeat protein [Verrucomicrobiae bacterium]
MKGARKKSAAHRTNSPKEDLSSSRPSQRRLWCFRLLVAMVVPLVLLGTTELVLRLIGFGYPTGFLRLSQREGQKVLVQNNRFGWRFFGPAMARIPQPVCLPQVKGSNTVRIVVLGESAAQGDPQPRFGLPRMLQALLELRYPGTRFEVVNAAMVAINSNVILPIARDCAAAGADVWVIYMGNNEVVGPFGAGTVFGPQAPPLPLIRASLAFNATRLGQLMDTLLRQIHKPPLDKSQWGGMEMFLEQQVPANDPRMSAVYDHFARNLRDIIAVGRRSGAGIVVSTVAVNLKDCAPFASAHRHGLSSTAQSAWDQLYQSGMAAQAAGKMAEAAERYRDAARIDNDYAELRYRQGCCALALGDTAAAQTEFAAARDLDTLRFRCDSPLNDLIRQTVSNYGDAGVELADAERAFAQQEPTGLPGDDLFYEHVHLTFDGNYLLARALAAKLQNLLPEKTVRQVAAGQPWPSEADCARRLAWSAWDKQQALSDVYSRLLKPPFTGQPNHETQVQKLTAALDKLIPATEPSGIKQAERLCESALAAAPDDPALCEQLAVLDQLSGDLAGAETNAQRTVRLLPGSVEGFLQLGVILAKQRKYADAAAAFRRAFELNPMDAAPLQNLAQSLKDLGQPEEAMREYRHALAVNPRFGLAWLGLGQVFEQMGRKAEAEDCYRKAVLNPINRAPELTTLARFCVSHGWRGAAATNFDAAIELNPADAMLCVEAGQNLAALGRHAEAAQHYAEAARIAPDLMAAHFLYGLELGRAGKPAEAAGQFREAVRIMPELPEARLNLGMALENEGNYSEALEQFEKVLEQNPNNAVALTQARAIRVKLSQAQIHTTPPP